MKPLIELLLFEVANIDGLSLKRRAFLVGRLRDVCSSVVANVRVESGNDHEALIEKLFDAVAVGMNGSNAVEVEGLIGISKAGSRVQDVIIGHWFENIEKSARKNGTTLKEEVSSLGYLND